MSICVPVYVCVLLQSVCDSILPWREGGRRAETEGEGKHVCLRHRETEGGGGCSRGPKQGVAGEELGVSKEDKRSGKGETGE